MDRADSRRDPAANGRPEDPADARKRSASSLIDSHDRVFRRTARRYSICTDDAEDAYQRSLEILLTKAPPIEGDGLVRWMQTVTKREALAVRRQRERLLTPRRPSSEDGDRDPLDSIASESPGPTDQAVRRERVTRSGEALRALKPQELRALTLKAQGYSYVEIGEITGWTYTKINRCMAEGRKRFLQVFSDIEQGRRCEELAAALSAFADGENGNGATEAVRAHLRGCATCRATLRAFRGVPPRVLGLLPAGPVMGQSRGGSAREWIAERAAVVVDNVKQVGYSAVARGSEDAVRIASGGGTRGAGMAGVAKVLAVCGATAAGSASCVATGLVDPAAVGLGSGKAAAPIERPHQADEGVSSESNLPTSADPAEASKDQSPPAPTVTSVQQSSSEVGFEAAAVSSGNKKVPSGGSVGEFSAGGSRSSGAGQGSGDGFGIEP